MPQSNVQQQFLSVNVTVDPQVTPSLGFNAALIMDATFSDSDVYRAYTSAADAAADSDLSTLAVAWVTAAFSQSKVPSTVYVIEYDSSGADTYADAATDAEDAGLNWYYTCIESRAAADIVTIAGWASSRRKKVIAQSADADWLTSGVPSGFSSLTTNNRHDRVYHPTDAQALDGAVAGFMAAIDLDNFPISGRLRIQGITTYSITSAQAAFARANFINTMEPATASSTTYLTFKGVTGTGEGSYVYIVKDWFESRTEDLIMADVVSLANQGKPYPYGPAGGDLLEGAVVKQAKRGLSVGHFVGNTAYPDGYQFTRSYTDGTRTNTVSGVIVLQDEAGGLAVTVNFDRGV